MEKRNEGYIRGSQNLEIREKYSAARRIFSSLLGVRKCDEILSLSCSIYYVDIAVLRAVALQKHKGVTVFQ